MVYLTTIPKELGLSYFRRKQFHHPILRKQEKHCGCSVARFSATPVD